ncbi:MAG: recombinase family protein, partial [Candidatus Pacebacteria bacterium]|nr:recombinase family protein [Candidatus Paceibacterota bacterium]
MQHALIVTRFSDEKQMGNTSTDIQMKSCRSYCKQNGFKVVGVKNFEATSADGTKSSNVERIKNLLSFCKDHEGKADVLVVYKLDRFSRSSDYHYYLKSKLLQMNISLRSATEPIDESPSGKLMEGMLAAIAQFDNDVKRERTKLAMRSLLERGIWAWQAPTGYMNVKNKYGKADVAQIDANCDEVIKEIFTKFNSGWTVTDIYHELKSRKIYNYKQRLLNFSQQFITKVLQNKFYMGILRVEKWDEEFEGQHQPLIKLILFKRCQLKINPGSDTSYRLIINEDFPLRDHLECKHCQQRMTAAWCKGKTKRYPLYYCKNKKCSNPNKKSVLKIDFEDEFFEFLKDVRPASDEVKRIKKEVIAVYEQRQSEFETRSDILRQKLNELTNQKQRLVKMVKQGAEFEDVKEDLKQIKSEIQEIKLELNESHTEEFKIELLLDYAETFLRNLPKFWFEADPANKVKLQRILFPHGIVYSYPGFSNTELSPLFKLFSISGQRSKTGAFFSKFSLISS